MLEKRGEKKNVWSTLTVPPTATYQLSISSQLILFLSYLWHQAQTPQAGRQANPSPAQLGTPVRLEEGTHLLHAADPSPTRQDTPKPLLHSPA